VNDKISQHRIERITDYPENKEHLVQNYTWNEFTLEELGLPDYTVFYNWVKSIETQVGIEGWRSHNGLRSIQHQGFSLTYNKDFKNAEVSVFHQTLGNDASADFYSSQENKNVIEGTDYGLDTYYDTAGFRHVHPVIENYFGSVFKKLKGAVMRSRVGYLYSRNFNFDNPKSNWHIDERPWEMIRLTIPVKTTADYVIRMHGDDGFGNRISNYEHSLQLGKAYMWNNRIPHQMAPKKISEDPRINIVIGFSPWFDYDPETDQFVRNTNWGIPISTIVKEKLFI
jgi:hypothetical protein